MYWNRKAHILHNTSVVINRNMRCIEIVFSKGYICAIDRLIETWDVLKSPVVGEHRTVTIWLIETWDVLKYFCKTHIRRCNHD